MTRGTLLTVVAATLLLVALVWLIQRARQTRGPGRAASSAQSPGRAPAAGPLPEGIPIAGPVETDAARSPDADALGAAVLEHLRLIEARGSPGLAAQVIPIFLHDTSARLAALREAVARHDGDTAHRVAHTLHGSAATIGAASLVRGSADIIREVRTGSFDRCLVILAQLDADFAAIRRTVSAHL